VSPFEVTPQISEHEQPFSRLISHRVPFSDVKEAFQLVLASGTLEKVVVTSTLAFPTTSEGELLPCLLQNPPRRAGRARNDVIVSSPA
jgi:hypothetical protein